MPVACIGHWYTSLLYLAPVVGLTAFLSAKTRLENRREAREAESRAPDAHGSGRQRRRTRRPRGSATA